MRVLLVLTITLSICMGVMILPGVLVILGGLYIGAPDILIGIMAIPSVIFGMFIGLGLLFKITESNFFDKLLG